MTTPKQKLINGKPFSYGICAQEDCYICRREGVDNCTLHSCFVTCPACHDGAEMAKPASPWTSSDCDFCYGRGAVPASSDFVQMLAVELALCPGG